MMKRNIELLIVIFNLITIRLEHFLQNYIDFIYIAVLLNFCISSSPKFSLLTITVMPIFAHFLYSITYIINDYINYHDDLLLRDQDPQKYSFYKYRPMQYFGKKIIVLLMVLYLTYIAILLRFISLKIYEAALIISIFSLLAIAESTAKKGTTVKMYIFFFQLLTKYIVFSVLLLIYSIGILPLQDSVLVAFYCVLPYALYRALGGILKGPGKQMRKILVVAMIIFVSAYALLSFFQRYLFIGILKAHLIVSVPFVVFIIGIPAMLFGITDRNVYELYRRLIIKNLIAYSLATIYLLAIAGFQ